MTHCTTPYTWQCVGAFGAWWVWCVALALYGAFRLWYDNWRGPLTAPEIEQFMQQIQSQSGAGHTDPAVLRQFLQEDDGKEFVMCNLVRLHPRPVPHPFNGMITEPRALMNAYVGQFLSVMLLRAGHPLVVSRKVAGYVDAWNAPPDAHWTVAAMVRYRSRRDMVRLAVHPRFVKAWPFKFAAVDKTFSFPSQVHSAMVLRPRTAVALVLMLVAALVHLASLLPLASLLSGILSG